MRNFILFFPILLFLSCSEFLHKIPSEAVQKGSLVVIDEANQSFYAVETNSNSVKLVGSFPTTTANDVEIDGHYAYFVISSPLGSPAEGNKLVRYDLSTGSSSVLSFPSDSNPYNLAIDSDSIYVTLSKSNMLAIVDKHSFVLSNLRLLPQPGMPFGLAFDLSNVYIATSAGWMENYSNSQIVVFRKTDWSTTSASVWTNPQSAAVCDGKLYVAATSDYSGTGRVQAVDLRTLAVSNLAIPATAPVFVKTWSGKLLVTDATWGGTGGLYVTDLSSGITTHLLAGSDLKGMDFADGRAYTTEGYLGSKIYQINLQTLSVITNSGPGGGDCALYR